MFEKKIKTMVSIEGMNCFHCVNKVKTTLEQLDNVKKVKVDLSKKKAIITSFKQIDIKKVQEKIENLDYKVIEIVEENI